MPRLNDTAALVDEGYRNPGSVTRSVRKIDNGYIVCDSSYNEKTQQYKSSETFSVEPPGRGNPSGGKVGNETLADVKKYLGSDV